MQQAEADRDRLVVESAELRATSQARGEELSRLQVSLGSLQQELESARAEAAESTEKLDEVSREKHVVEVEYRSYKEHHGSSSTSQVEAIAELKVAVDRLSMEVETKSTEVVEQKGSIMQQEAYVSQLEEQLRRAERGRRDLHNTIQVRGPPCDPPRRS